MMWNLPSLPNVLPNLPDLDLLACPASVDMPKVDTFEGRPAPSQKYDRLRCPVYKPEVEPATRAQANNFKNILSRGVGC